MPDWVRHGPMALWRRSRWPVVASAVGVLIVLYLLTRSVLSSIIWLFVIALIVVVALILLARFAARSGGGAGPWPWMGAPPQRAAQDIWQAALRHLPDTFSAAPDRTLLAAEVVELRMNPADLRALGESLDPAVVTSSSCDAYRARIAEQRARVSGPGQPRVALVSDPDLPPGRYRLEPQSTEPLSPAPPAGSRDTRVATGLPEAHTVAVDQLTAHEEPLTVAERPLAPSLRLLTGGTVAETRKSGARAGRGNEAELKLPDIPTVSRVHAEFTYADGKWWITNQGRNGLTVNGSPVNGQAPVSDGDVIQWGNRHDALTSRVQVG